MCQTNEVKAVLSKDICSSSCAANPKCCRLYRASRVEEKHIIFSMDHYFGKAWSIWTKCSNEFVNSLRSRLWKVTHDICALKRILAFFVAIQIVDIFISMRRHHFLCDKGYYLYIARSTLHAFWTALKRYIGSDSFLRSMAMYQVWRLLHSMNFENIFVLKDVSSAWNSGIVSRAEDHWCCYARVDVDGSWHSFLVDKRELH